MKPPAREVQVLFLGDEDMVGAFDAISLPIRDLLLRLRDEGAIPPEECESELAALVDRIQKAVAQLHTADAAQRLISAGRSPSNRQN